EDGAATLTRLLRRVEIAGHDPHAVLREAITRRDLADARQITNVLQRRITDHVSLAPRGDGYADWIPSVPSPQWAGYLLGLAEKARQRELALGDAVAAEQPQWAVEALGPIPSDPEEVNDWKERAARVAAHRELTGQDDPAEALGPAPKP